MDDDYTYNIKPMDHERYRDRLDVYERDLLDELARCRYHIDKYISELLIAGRSVDELEVYLHRVGVRVPKQHIEIMNCKASFRNTGVAIGSEVLNAPTSFHVQNCAIGWGPIREKFMTLSEWKVEDGIYFCTYHGHKIIISGKQIKDDFIYSAEVDGVILSPEFETVNEAKQAAFDHMYQVGLV